VLPLIALATVLALGGALLLYLGPERAGPSGVPLALLRALAWLGVAALLLDPGCRSGPAPPTVLLDQSQSLSDPAGDARWKAAVDSARRLAAGGPVVLFGATPRAWHERARPDAPTSLLLPTLREAVSRGGPIAIVTDGEVDDAAALPADVMRAARVVIVARPRGPDAGLAAVRIPPVLRAGDTATAEVAVVVRQATTGDSGSLELREDGRIAARQRIGLGAGSVAAVLRFVPAPPPGGERVVRRYEARLTGFARDVEPRDDARATVAAVTRAAAVALFSESPDWDFRWLGRTLRSARATPVRSFVRVAEGPWRDAATLAPVSEAAARAAAQEAALVIAHGPEAAIDAIARLARRSVWRWPTGGGAQTGDWYVAPEPGASPLGAALAGVPVESLPPLSALRTAPADSTAWSAVLARAGRRGSAQPVFVGGTREGRRWLTVLGSGLWRWASRGGVAAEGYRALVLGAADWSLERRTAEDGEVLAVRDSLAREGVEFLPRAPTLAVQAGVAERATRERVPLQQRPLVFGAILVALCVEWVARRRRGMR
jgi:hypothetical protein